MSKANTTAVSTPSVLAFERKLDPSDAFFYSGNWDQRDKEGAWQAITLLEKSVRGTISNRMKGSAPDPVKFDADIQKPNLQTVDAAALPEDCDTLRHRFSLRVLGDCGKPSACNGLAYQTKLLSTVAGYAKEHEFSELARRYAINLANGRCLWRNRVGSEQVEVHVRQIVQGKAVQHLQFDALQFSLRDFDVPAAYQTQIATLEKLIAGALQSSGYLLLEVTSFARMGKGLEVYPSQELILDKKESKKSKTLYQVNKTAAMHSQKVGNALRSIDTWYEGDDHVGPIAVEPYGSVTALGKAFRQPKKLDFYSLLDNWLTKDQQPAPEQQHYVIANLIRGGVYGEAEKG